MAVTLVRVDDRVIHGQTTTRWTAARDVFGMIVVGDKIHENELRKRVLKAAAGNYRLGIYDETVGIEKIAQAFDAPRPYFIIAESPQVFANMVRNGADIGKTLNVGPMNTRPGTKVLGRTVAIDAADYEAFEYLHDQGIKIEFQLLPDDEIRGWPEMKKRYDEMD